MSEERNEYEVGYGRPPVGSRFKPGQSGNPNGRPKGKRNLRAIADAVLNEMISVTENGRTVQMTKGEAAIRQQVNKAIMGDPKAIRETLRLFHLVEQLPEEAAGETATSESDQAVMKSLMRRMQQAVSTKPTEGRNDE